MNKTKGYVHIYTGDGKGKTTAAVGLAVRAAGHGMETYMGQFMKGQLYGELAFLKETPCITVEQYGDTACIRKEDISPKHMNQAAAGIAKAEQAMRSGIYDIVILDEVNVAVWFGLLEEKQVLGLMDKRPAPVEMVLTGRRATPAMIAKADLVTEMKEIRHYYSRGVLARDGIER